MDSYQVYNEDQMSNLPFHLEAEQSVLGSILLKPDIVNTVMEFITKPEMFYKKQHRDLFSVIVNMFNMDKNIDFVTLLSESINAKVFETDDIAKTYLVTLMELVPTLANIVDYCRIVVEKYYIRTLIMACSEISQKSMESDVDARTILDLAEQRIYDIRQGKDLGSLTKIDTVIIEAYDRLQKLTSEDKDKYLGLKTGFKRLDITTSGLNKSDLILVAARPGMGKTSFALNIATNVAKKYDKSVVIFSLEMSNEQLISRVLSSESKIKSDRIRTGNLSIEDWKSLAKTADRISKTNIYLDDTAGNSVAQMKAKLRRVKDLGLVVIDYLQLMSNMGRNENRVQEISQITRNLKIMAKELNVPVVLLSQLSRATEQRQGHKPILSDLRDSGSIEQDADIVLFLYREGYYNEDVEDNRSAVCIVAKNRHGSTGDIDISWCGEFTRFDDLDAFREEPDGRKG